jgi:hypothetical protein
MWGESGKSAQKQHKKANPDQETEFSDTALLVKELFFS